MYKVRTVDTAGDVISDYNDIEMIIIGKAGMLLQEKGTESLADLYISEDEVIMIYKQED